MAGSGSLRAVHALALLFAVLALAPGFALADFDGRVMKVIDGDTVTVLVNKTQIKVRLDSIDAPEADQPYYRRSKDSLAELCAGKDAHVIEHGRDRYGRAIGLVHCAGIDANSEQVRRGFAWVFLKYAPAGSQLYKLEQAARQNRTGLWADARPMPPWDWRAAARARGNAKR
jgi:endonuclease YncB( thermonuclease family)